MRRHVGVADSERDGNLRVIAAGHGAQIARSSRAHVRGGASGRRHHRSVAGVDNDIFLHVDDSAGIRLAVPDAEEFTFRLAGGVGPGRRIHADRALSQQFCAFLQGNRRVRRFHQHFHRQRG